MNLHKAELNLCLTKSLARLQRQQMIYNVLSEILPDRRARHNFSYFNHEFKVVCVLKRKLAGKTAQDVTI